MNSPSPDSLDRSSPTLLIVSLVTILVAVAGVVGVALTDAGWAVGLTVLVLLAGLVIVSRTMWLQLAEEGDDG